MGYLFFNDTWATIIVVMKFISTGHEGQVLMSKTTVCMNDRNETENVTDPEQLVQAMEKTSAMFDRSVSFTISL